MDLLEYTHAEHMSIKIVVQHCSTYKCNIKLNMACYYMRKCFDVIKEYEIKNNSLVDYIYFLLSDLEEYSINLEFFLEKYKLDIFVSK